MTASDDHLSSFKQAVDLVQDDPQRAAFAFYPTRRGTRVVGGTIFLVVPSAHDADPPGEAWRVETTGRDSVLSSGVESHRGFRC
jgi:hypothetical protein